MLNAIPLDYKMNNIINQFLLAGDKFMPETHLRDPVVGTYSVCGPFTKHKKRIQKVLESGNTKYIYKNDLDKACFAHDAVYSDSINLTKRTAADKILKNKAYEIANNLEDNGHKRGLASMVYKFFNKKTGSGVKSIPQNEQLAEELHQPIIKKFKERRVYLAFKDNVWVLSL